MCGRFILNASLPTITDRFGIRYVPSPAELGHGDRLDLPERYNISPGTDILAVGVRDGQRTLRPLHWGLVPAWAKDPAIGNRMANARAEGIDSKPSFRSAFQKRRVLVPASGFYEWQDTGEKTKQPWFISPTTEELFAFAGLWEFWRRPEGGNPAWPAELRTVCLITTAPNGVMWGAQQKIHDRMPVIVPQASWSTWLDPQAESADLHELLQPIEDSAVQAWKVSRAVSKVSNQGPELIRPIGQDERSEAPEPPQGNSK